MFFWRAKFMIWGGGGGGGGWKIFFLENREFELKGAIEKYVSCFLLYLFQEVFILHFLL